MYLFPLARSVAGPWNAAEGVSALLQLPAKPRIGLTCKSSVDEANQLYAYHCVAADENWQGAEKL